MLKVEIDGGVELRQRLRFFTPDLADNLENQMLNAMNPIVKKARGFAPVQAPLTTWARYSMVQKGRFPYYNVITVRQGITATTKPSKPNRKGFSYAASILNTTAAGAIYETSGRKHPNGRKQAPKGNTSRRYSQSSNPEAGKQFIAALGALYKVPRRKGQKGRSNKKMNGRLIYRAYGEDQGRVYGAINTSIDQTIRQFHARTKNRFINSTKKAV